MRRAVRDALLYVCHCLDGVLEAIEWLVVVLLGEDD